MSSPFRMFRHLNDPELMRYAGLSSRIDARSLPHFPGDGLPDRVVRALAERRALPVKEVFESFEFFERVRRDLRAEQMADLCCGHGLTGLLFALFERRVSRVTLLDRRRPESYEVVFEAVCSVGPWVADKVTYVQSRIRDAEQWLEPGTSIIAIHACGPRTDRCIEVARHLGGNLAVMPCCYASSSSGAPDAVVGALGPGLAVDVDRTYRLEAAGYRVKWTSIPEEVTPMCRVLIGKRETASLGKPETTHAANEPTSAED